MLNNTESLIVSSWTHALALWLFSWPYTSLPLAGPCFSCVGDPRAWSSPWGGVSSSLPPLAWCWYWGALKPRCRNLHSASLSFMMFTWVHSWSLSRALHLQIYEGLHSFPKGNQLHHSGSASSANLLRIHLISLLLLLLKILNLAINADILF